MAIFFESLAFGIVAAFVLNRIAKNAFVGIGAGVLSGLISAAVWVCFAIYVMNAPAYSRVVTTVGAYIPNQGVIQAVFLGIFLPLGYLAGEKLSARTSLVPISRPIYYAASTAIVVFCWGISILAIASGL